MILQKKFSISGSMSASGDASYSYNPDTGVLQYGLNAKVYLGGFIPFNQNNQGMMRVDPHSVLSSNFKQGQKFNFGNVSIEVVSIVGKVAHAKVVVGTDIIQEVGDAVFSLAGQYIELESMTTQGKIEGLELNLNLAGA